MDLSKLIKRKERLVWVEYRPGFDVQLRYVPLQERIKTLDQGSGHVVLRAGKLQQDGLNKGLEANTAAMIQDWKLPAAVAVQLLEIEPEDLDGVEQIPCTDDNKLTLIREVSGFAVFVNNMATVLENFRAAELKAEVENLPQS